MPAKKKTPPKIGFLCASLREGSINARLEAALIKRFKAAGAKTGRINLAKYPMPIFHGNLKAPASVKKFISRAKSFDGIVVISPEYNGCLPPRRSAICHRSRGMNETSRFVLPHVC